VGGVFIFQSFLWSELIAVEGDKRVYMINSRCDMIGINIILALINKNGVAVWKCFKIFS